MLSTPDLMASIVLSFLLGATTESPGVDLFIEACRWQGTNPSMIYNGHAEYEVTVTEQPKSEDAIQKEIEERIASLRERIAKSTQPALRESLDQAIRRTPDAIRKQRTGVRRSRYKVTFEGNDPSGQRRMELSNFNPLTDRWDRPLVQLRNKMSKSGGDNVLWDQNANQAIISHQHADAGDFQAFGRIQGLPSRMGTASLLRGGDPVAFTFLPESIVDFKAELERLRRESQLDPLVLAGETDYDGNAHAFIIESRVKHEEGVKLVQRYWIDASRGYVCPLIQFFNESGAVTLEYRSSKYFYHEASGLWFPAEYVEMIIQDDGTIQSRKDYRIDPITFRLNYELPENEFALELPVGTVVVDARQQDQPNFTATSLITLSLAEGGLDLDSQAGLAPRVITNDPPPILPGMSYGRMALIVNSLLLILVVIWLWKRRSIKQALTIGLFIPSICANQGCSSGDLRVRQEMAKGGGIRIEPTILDFGRVRETMSPVETEFLAVNDGSQPRELTRIEPGCGCTVADFKPTTINSGESLTIPLKINVRGKVGGFSNQVMLYSKGLSEPIPIPVTGVVVRDIWYDEQPIRMARTHDDHYEGHFELHTEDFPEVKLTLSLNSADVELEELSRTTSVAETVMKFRLNLPADDFLRGGGRIFHVTLIPNLPDLKPLTISLLKPSVLPTESVQHNRQTISPQRISLGSMERGSIKRQQLFRKLGFNHIKIGKCEGFPDGISLSLQIEDNDGSAYIVLTPNESVHPGIFRGVISLLDDSSETELDPIEIVGLIR